MRTWIIVPIGLALLTTACGETTGQRATTGAAGGAVAGAVVGGPVGAVVGGVGGAAGGAYRDNVDNAVDNTSQDVAQATQNRSSSPGTAQTSTAPRSGLTNEQVRDAQTTLSDLGLYHGKIDGIYGPQTRAAVSEFQAQQNLPRTMALDMRTRQALQNQTASKGRAGSQIGETPPEASPPPANPPAAPQ
jgi:peptidoglycan hydrolase-like protein with peptidoglycan-binding domain